MKICGLSRLEDAEAINGLRPEMAGMVFYGPSRRCVTKGTAMGIREALDPSIAAVGVFVDEDPLVIADLVDSGIIDAVQLHGVEDEAYIHGLRRLVDVPVIKAFILDGEDVLDRIGSSSADMVLLDSGKGSGRRFDWSLAARVRRDYILSGGLDPSNVGEAVSSLDPYGVDVSSGVETDGRKDPAKMAAFVSAARGI